MKEFWKNGFGKLHQFLVDNELSWIYILLIIVYILGVSVAWLIVNFKKKEEITKLRVEVEKLSYEINKLKTEVQRENFNRLLSLGEAYKSSNKPFQTKLIEFGNSKKSNDFANLAKIRLELQSLFLNEIFDTFNAYFTFFYEIFNSNNEKLAKFALEEGLIFIRLSARFLSSINSEQNLRITEQREFRINQYLFQSIFKFMDNSLPTEAKADYIEYKSKILSFIVQRN